MSREAAEAREIVNQDTDFDPESVLVPAFADLKLEFHSVVTGDSRLCKVCNKPILVERKAHPEVHTSCLLTSRSSSATLVDPSSPSSSLTPTNCSFCGQKIIIRYKEHPSLHTKCKSAKFRGEEPRVLESSTSTASPSTAAATRLDDIDNLFEAARSAFRTNFELESNLTPRKSDETMKIDLSERLASFSSSELIEFIEKSSDYYEVLGVDVESPLDLIKLNYKRLAIRLHPDKCVDGSEAFKKISHAFAILSNDDSRRSYNVARKSGPLDGTSRDDLERYKVSMRVNAADLQFVSTMFEKLFVDLNKALFGGPH